MILRLSCFLKRPTLITSLKLATLFCFKQCHPKIPTVLRNSFRQPLTEEGYLEQDTLPLPSDAASSFIHKNVANTNTNIHLGIFCDSTLIVEGEKFPVHRSFLAANSDYFLSLFTSAEEQHNFVLAGVPQQGEAEECISFISLVHLALLSENGELITKDKCTQKF